MKIQLKPEQENLIKAQIASGKYKSTQEIVDKMFVMWGRLEENYEQWLEDTQQKIEEGIESLDKGQGIETEIVINNLKNRLNQKSMDNSQ